MDADLSFSSIVDEPRTSRPALDHALSIVEAVSDAGLTAVPVKPTTAMLTAGARAGHVNVETAWRIYQAMIKEEG